MTLDCADKVGVCGDVSACIPGLFTGYRFNAMTFVLQRKLPSPCHKRLAPLAHIVTGLIRPEDLRRRRVVEAPLDDVLGLQWFGV